MVMKSDHVLCVLEKLWWRNNAYITAISGVVGDA